MIPTVDTGDARLNTVFADRFRLDQVIGSGGFATVYLAFDLLLSRPVALKLPHQPTRDLRERFARESRILAETDSANLPKVLAQGVDLAGLPFLAMEYCPGQALEEILSEGTVAEVDLIQIVLQVSDALTALHSAGIVHRDIKPGNIIVCQDSGKLSVKLIDLGSAHSLDENQTTPLTSVAGSLFYLSPEHFTPSLLDPRSDIFSLGCVMYRCLAGSAPYCAEAPMQLLNQMNLEKRRPLSSSVSPKLRTCVDRCLSPSPAGRFQNAEELKEHLFRDDSAFEDLPITSNKRTVGFRLLALLSVLAFIAVVALVYILTGARKPQTVNARFPYTPDTAVRSLLRASKAENNKKLQQQHLILQELQAKELNVEFWRKSGYDLAKQLVLCGAYQLDNGHAQDADVAFKLSTKCKRDRFQNIELNYLRLLHLENYSSQTNFLREIAYWREQAVRLGRPDHQARLTALLGMSQHELGKHLEAANSFQESLKELETSDIMRDAITALGDIVDKPPGRAEAAEVALRAATCLQETRNQKFVEKKADLLNTALHLLSEVDPSEVTLESGWLVCGLIETLSPEKRKPVALSAAKIFQGAAAAKTAVEANSRSWRELNDRLNHLAGG